MNTTYDTHLSFPTPVPCGLQLYCFKDEGFFKVIRFRRFIASCRTFPPMDRLVVVLVADQPPRECEYPTGQVLKFLGVCLVSAAAIRRLYEQLRSHE